MQTTLITLKYWRNMHTHIIIDVLCYTSTSSSHFTSRFDRDLILSSASVIIPSANLTDIFNKCIFETFATTPPVIHSGRPTHFTFRGIKRSIIDHHTFNYIRIGDTYGIFRNMDCGLVLVPHTPSNHFIDSTFYITEPIVMEIETYGTVKMEPGRSYRNRIVSVPMIVPHFDTVNGFISKDYRLRELDGLANWDVSNVTSMDLAFEWCSSMIDISGLANWDVSSVKSMRRIFGGCFRLVDLNALSGWDTSHVIDMMMAFHHIYAPDLEGLHRWDVSKVRSMFRMFGKCNEIIDADAIIEWNVDEDACVTEMFGDKCFEGVD